MVRTVGSAIAPSAMPICTVEMATYVIAFAAVTS